LIPTSSRLNTATYRHYIDFCAEQGIPYHTLDGTDTAWYGGPIVPDGPTDITKAVPEIDLPELFRYAMEKGVRLRLWMHWRALAPQIDEVFPLYEKWGVEGVMVDFMDRDDQEMVNFYHDVAEKAARKANFAPWRTPTGMERTGRTCTYEARSIRSTTMGREGTPEHGLANACADAGRAGRISSGRHANVLPADQLTIIVRLQGTRGQQLAMLLSTRTI
jgi:hypothetical protein